MVYQHSSNVVGVINTRDLLGGSLNVVDNRHEKKGRLKYRYLVMAIYDSLDASRAVHFSTYVSLRSLLKLGEAPPDGDYWHVFV